MKEDFSPYMIPNPSAPYDSRYIHEKNTREGPSLYLKSATFASSSPRLKELQTLLAATTATYVSNFKVDDRIPYYVHHGFDRDMELFPQNFANQVANTYHSATGNGVSASKAITTAYDEVKTGLRTLSAKLNSYDHEFSTWFTLESLQRQDYTRYLFISEQNHSTCDRCLSYHGKVFSLADVPIPPLHPNCRCELLVMDARTEALYHLNEQAFIERFRQIRSGVEGGVYLVDHEAFPFGITPENLTRVSLPSGHMIMDLGHPESLDRDNDYDLLSEATSYLSSLASDAKDLIGYLLNAQA